MSFHKRMAPNHHFMLHAVPMEPVSRTYQYRKIMKPMLERKRRARINKSLDELKDLMSDTLQADGENMSKLEKADILELTVRHLQRLRENNALFPRNTDPPNMEKYWTGFQHCVAEVMQFLSKYDRNINSSLMKHLAGHVPQMTASYQRLCAAVVQRLPVAATLVPPLYSGDIGPSTSPTNNPTSVRYHPYAMADQTGDAVWRPW